MHSDKKVILIGGFCEIYELCDKCHIDIVGVVDHSSDVTKGYDVPYLGTDDEFIAKKSSFIDIPLLVLPDKPVARRKLAERYREEGFNFGRLIAPDADISPSAKIGQGTIIQSHSIVEAKAIVGEFVKINMSSLIGHESKLADYVTVAPLSMVSGCTFVGSCSYIGMRSTMVPGISIGENSVIGIGSVVTCKRIPDNKVVFGNPASVMWDNA